MVGWHHRLNRHGFGWIPGVGDGQGGLVCCGSWGRRESDATERLNWTECPLSQWFCLTDSSSAAPFSFCLQSFQASESFQLFASGGQSIGAWAQFSELNQSLSFSNSLELTGLISLQSKGLSRVFSNTTVQKHQFFGTQPSLWSISYPYMTTGKTVALTIWTFVSKVMSPLLNSCLGLS